MNILMILPSMDYIFMINSSILPVQLNSSCVIQHYPLIVVEHPSDQKRQRFQKQNKGTCPNFSFELPLRGKPFPFFWTNICFDWSDVHEKVEKKKRI